MKRRFSFVVLFLAFIVSTLVFPQDALAANAKLTRKKDKNGVYQIFSGKKQITNIALNKEWGIHKGIEYGVMNIAESSTFALFTFRDAVGFSLIHYLNIYLLDKSNLNYVNIAAYTETLDQDKYISIKGDGFGTLSITGTIACEGEFYVPYYINTSITATNDLSKPVKSPETSSAAKTAYSRAKIDPLKNSNKSIFAVTVLEKGVVKECDEDAIGNDGEEPIVDCAVGDEFENVIVVVLDTKTKEVLGTYNGWETENLDQFIDP